MGEIACGPAIEHACRVAGLSQREVQNRTGISQSTLSRIIAGTRPVKAPELVLIAAATGCTIAQLTGSALSNRVLCAARAVNQSSMQGMYRRLLHYLELSDYLDGQAIARIAEQGPSVSGAESSGQAAAEEFRRVFGLGGQPLGDLVTLVEHTTGLDVAVLRAAPDEHGLTVHDPGGEVTIVGVACTPHPMRQRSTLAHELAHVWFRDWTDSRAFGVRDEAEKRADIFARHLLLPLGGLRQVMGSRGSCGEAELSAIVQRFLVSPAIAAIALHQGNYIDQTTKEHWLGVSTRQLATRYGWLDHYRSLQLLADRERTPQQLLTRAISGFQAGVVSLQTIATLRGGSLADTKQDLDHAGISPVEKVMSRVLATELPPAGIDDEELAELLPEDPTE